MNEPTAATTPPQEVRVPPFQFTSAIVSGREYISKAGLLQLLRETKDANDVEAVKAFCDLLYQQISEAATRG